MNTLRRLIHGETLRAIAWVAAGFLALFGFFDLVEELQNVARHAAGGYGVAQALAVVALLVPSHLYELLPIAVLIGTIFVLTRMAQSSEFTILRTSGLGPWRALSVLLGLGLGFVVLTFVIGDYLAPVSDRASQLLKARYTGRISVGQTGAWLKERQADGRAAVNVGALGDAGQLHEVRIFEFDTRGYLRSLTEAAQAHIGTDSGWALSQVKRTTFPDPLGAPGAVSIESPPSWHWPSSLTHEMVSAAVLKPERMRALDLLTYVRHLQANGQAAQRYQIEFWRKIFYPLSCLVMVVLATPFAYLHFRTGGIGGYVFTGILVGISFFLLNNVASYMGTLHAWPAWLAAALPGLTYSVLSLSAFSWMVLRR